MGNNFYSIGFPAREPDSPVRLINSCFHMNFAWLPGSERGLGSMEKMRQSDENQGARTRCRASFIRRFQQVFAMPFSSATL
jgi:hypothetical protein